MKQDNLVKTLMEEYSRGIYRLRCKIRNQAPGIIGAVLREVNAYRPDASKLKNVYYLDYDRLNRTMLWRGFDPKDAYDKKDLATLRSYFEGDQAIYEEMRLDELSHLPGYLSWAVENKKAGYAPDSQKADSVNPELDKKLGYFSCIHVPLCRDYRLEESSPGEYKVTTVDNVIGDIILAHPDVNGILRNVIDRQKAAGLIAEKLYRKCRVAEDYYKLRASKRLLDPVLEATRKQFSYFFDTKLRTQYLGAVKKFSESFSGNEKKKPLVKSLLHFLFRLNNMLNGTKHGLVPWGELITQLYGEGTPLLDWIKRLDKSEDFFSDVTHYREHVRHIINVYMLGIVALASGYGRFVQEQLNANFQKLKGSTPSPDVALIGSIWTVIAFSHDALYALEKTPKIADALGGLFGGATDKKASSLSSDKDREKSTVYAPYVLGNLSSVARHLVDMEGLVGRKIKNSDAEYVHRVNQTLCGLLTQHTKHDILGGVALETELRKKSTITKSPSKLWKEVLKKLNSDSTHYYKNVIATAVAYHHGWEATVKLSEDEKDFEMPKVWIEIHPLLVLLILCDGIHNWGRKMEYKSINQIRFVSFRHKKNTLVFRLNLDCSGDRAKTILDGYREHLGRPFKKKISARRNWDVKIILSNRHWPSPRLVRLK